MMNDLSALLGGTGKEVGFFWGGGGGGGRGNRYFWTGDHV